MRRLITVASILFLLHSCIPIRIAPSIADYKLVKGKRFKRSLPKQQMFVFENPKDANHFYDYVNIKYQLQDENVFDYIPFEIDGQQYFFSFYEVDIPTKTINLIPIIIDALLDRRGVDPILEEEHTSRIGTWYIAIEVYSDIENDCLEDSSLFREVVLKYLRALKEEYLSTHNYNEVVFKN